MAYYPWIDTTVLPLTAIGLDGIGPNLRKSLSQMIADAMEADAEPGSDAEARNKGIEELAAAVKQADPSKLKETHDAAMAFSEHYKVVMSQAFGDAQPDAARTGNGRHLRAKQIKRWGYSKRPANIPMNSVVRPTVEVSHDEQENLNVPLDGKAINALRSFPGRGVLVWGARTLDGNSQGWRYISVRRTLIMLEQSINARLKPMSLNRMSLQPGKRLR